MKKLPAAILLGLGALVSRSASALEPAAPDRPRGEEVLAGPDATAHDRVLVTAPALPAPGTIRLDARAGMERDGEDDASGLAGAGTLVALASLGHGFGAELSGRLRHGSLTPGAALRYQLVAQRTSRIVDVTAAVRYGSFGLERTDLGGGALGAELALGRTFGRLALTTSGLVGRGIVDRDDVDAIVAGAIMITLAGTWQVGMEGRARTELVDRYETEEDHGRPTELTFGLASACRVGPVFAQVLGGYQAPRGMAAAGPVGIAGVSASF